MTTTIQTGAAKLLRVTDKGWQLGIIMLARPLPRLTLATGIASGFRTGHIPGDIGSGRRGASGYQKTLNGGPAFDDDGDVAALNAQGTGFCYRCVKRDRTGHV